MDSDPAFAAPRVSPAWESDLVAGVVVGAGVGVTLAVLGVYTAHPAWVYGAEFAAGYAPAIPIIRHIRRRRRA